jgi:prepilin-type N-terminal cleavage/methylation domain-containing protein
MKSVNVNANPKQSSGFTLVELMVVIAIIAVLTAVAVPQALRARDSSVNAAFVADLRVAKGAFVLYNSELGDYPPDRTPAVYPAEIAPYLDSSFKWSADTPIGGKWDWDYHVFGFVAGVSVYQPTVGAAQMTRIDQTIDDGNLGTGDFQTRSGGYISVLE